ncbi:class I SAM-dependent methyltransferase [Glycomyces sp. NRRL B-16210]|uniref:class I SAM-dependent DNA methyltransferase n=1 Tax=Glycomyces sp. NRRL B-16210 TaxID=1463821 RepID=UPI0004C14030|nr:class I SAM-dependent methyltransferase [Glycomyces sp. NRRL B-16210]
MGETDVRSTREGYDAAAQEYAERFKHSLRDHPFDRAMIGAFAELVQASGLPVIDIGCGPGYVTEHLRELGLPVRGVDLSPEMVALARRDHPEIEFSVGEMTALDVPDGGLGGLFSRSSIIHTPPERLPETFAAFHRMLATGGHLLLCFQADDEASELAQPFDHAVALAYRLSVGGVAGLLREAGFSEVARQVVAPDEDPIRGFHYCHLLVRKGPKRFEGAGG